MLKNALKIVVISFLLVNCKQKIEPTDIMKLNGYWEIEKVVFDGGDHKGYKINETFDYFEIDIDNKGIRQKVMPQLNGTFLTNDLHEDIKIRFKNDIVFIDYKTVYAEWSEEIIALTDNKLVLKNKENKEYHYKKASKIKLLEDGKKTK